MAIIRKKDLHKMNQKERIEKINEIRFELVKASVTANKAKSKTKELKRTLSRLLTLNNSQKEALKN
jgi:ribosomal protein L29